LKLKTLELRIEQGCCYIVKHSRPDISNALRELSNQFSAPNEAAYKEMLRDIVHLSQLNKTQ